MGKCKNCGEEIPFDHAQVGGVHMTCEHDYFHKKDQCVVKVRPYHGRGEWLVETKESFMNFLDAIEDLDEMYEIKLQMMSKGEIENLPEFKGW